MTCGETTTKSTHCPNCRHNGGRKFRTQKLLSFHCKTSTRFNTSILIWQQWKKISILTSHSWKSLGTCTTCSFDRWKGSSRATCRCRHKSCKVSTMLSSKNGFSQQLPNSRVITNGQKCAPFTFYENCREFEHFFRKL